MKNNYGKYQPGKVTKTPQPSPEEWAARLDRYAREGRFTSTFDKETKNLLTGKVTTSKSTDEDPR